MLQLLPSLVMGRDFVGTLEANNNFILNSKCSTLSQFEGKAQECTGQLRLSSNGNYATMPLLNQGDAMIALSIGDATSDVRFIVSIWDGNTIQLFQEGNPYGSPGMLPEQGPVGWCDTSAYQAAEGCISVSDPVTRFNYPGGSRVDAQGYPVGPLPACDNGVAECKFTLTIEKQAGSAFEEVPFTLKQYSKGTILTTTSTPPPPPPPTTSTTSTRKLSPKEECLPSPSLCNGLAQCSSQSVVGPGGCASLCGTKYPRRCVQTADARNPELIQCERLKSITACVGEPGCGWGQAPSYWNSAGGGSCLCQADPDSPGCADVAACCGPGGSNAALADAEVCCEALYSGSNSGDDSVFIGIIVGIVMGVLAFFIIAVVLRQRAQRRAERDLNARRNAVQAALEGETSTDGPSSTTNVTTKWWKRLFQRSPVEEQDTSSTFTILKKRRRRSSDRVAFVGIDGGESDLGVTRHPQYNPAFVIDEGYRDVPAVPRASYDTVHVVKRRSDSPEYVYRDDRSESSDGRRSVALSDVSGAIAETDLSA